MPTVSIKFRFLSTVALWTPSTGGVLSTSLSCVPAEDSYTVSCVATQSVSYAPSCVAEQSVAYTPSCVVVDSHGLYPL